MTVEFDVAEGIQISVLLAKLDGMRAGYLQGIADAEQAFAEYLQAKAAVKPTAV